MTGVARWAIIDDINPALHYSGNWGFSLGETDRIGNATGPAYHRTLHKAQSAAAFVNVTFEGTAFRFFGTSNSTGEKTAPSYTCRLDGVPVSDNWVEGLENNVELCEAHDFPAGVHTASWTLDTLPADGRPALFDYVSYQPTQGALLNDTPEHVERGDPRIYFGADWETYWEDAETFVSTSTGADLSLTFEGVSLTLFGILLFEDGFKEGQGSYTLDNGTAITFPIPAGNTTMKATHYDYPYFNLTSLPPGKHELKVKDVTYESPLTFSYFEVTNTSFTPGAVGGPSDPLTSTSTSNGLSKGAIAGIAVGAAALVAVLVGLLIIFLRRRPKFVLSDKDPEEQESDSNHIDKFPLGLEPTLPRISSTLQDPESPDATSPKAPPVVQTQSSAKPTDSPLKDTAEAVTPPAAVSLPSGKTASDTSAMHISNPAPTSPTSPLEGGVYVRHTDSGVRMSSAVNGDLVVDIPPEYVEH